MPSKSRIHSALAVTALVLLACGQTRSLGEGIDASGDGDGDGDGDGANSGQSPDEQGVFHALSSPEALATCGARAISGDGRIAGGYCQIRAGSNVQMGALWDVEKPSMPTAIRGGGSVRALVLNGDGTVVFATDDEATFRWRDGEITAVPELKDAKDTNHDGSRVVGTCYRGGSYPVACSWTEEEGTLPLHAASSRDSSRAHAISADGSVTVGEFGGAGRSSHAARWESGKDLELLPIPSDAWKSSADAISADGKVIGGTISVDSGTRPIVWTKDGFELPTDGGGRMVALNEDGSRVLLDIEASPYLLEDGTLRSVYEVAGVPELTFSGYGAVRAASDDLRAIISEFEAGSEIFPYIVRLP